jgi:hypothetical protein
MEDNECVDIVPPQDANIQIPNTKHDFTSMLNDFTSMLGMRIQFPNYNAYMQTFFSYGTIAHI